MTKDTSTENQHNVLSDKELIEGIISGRNRSLVREYQEQIYARYSAKVYYKIFAITKDKEVSKDLSHDVFIKIFTKLSTFRRETHFYSWISSITYNHCITYLKKNQKWPLENLEDHSYHLENGSISLHEKIEKEEMLLKLERLMHQLSEKDRMILIMRYIDNMPIKEISAILEIGDSAAKMRLKRSRDALAKLFTQ